MSRSPTWLPFIVCALSAAAAAAAPQVESAPLPDRQVNSQADPCVRLRVGASLDRPILDCLEPGTRLRLLGALSGWSHIRLADGTEGWVDSNYLELAPQPGASPASTADPPAAEDGLRQELEILADQLRAEAERRNATEERLHTTVEATEAAQREASLLRQQLQQLQDQTEPAGDQAELAAAQDRIRQLESELGAAQDGLARAASLNAEQEQRIEALDAALAAADSGRVDRQQALAATEARLRDAEQANAAQAERIAQLEAERHTPRDREAELSRADSAADERAAEQARRIEALTAQLADAERRVAAAELRARLADEGRQPAAPSAGDRISVRTPIVAAPEPPRVEVRQPAVIDEAPAAPAPSPIEAAVETVHAWAAAWSDQRVEDYLSFYAEDFRPPDGLDRTAWEEQRRERLRRPAYIRVTISSLAAEPAGEDAVRATFGQEYESDTFADRVTKVMTLVDRGGRWRILTERSTP